LFIEVDGIDGSFFLFGKIEHDVHHDFLDDASESTGTDTLGVGFFSDRRQGVFGELKLAVFHSEQGLVLLDQRIFRFGQDLDQSGDVQRSHTETSILSFAPIAVKPRGWILLIAICATILSSFGIIGSSLFFISAASAPGAGPIKALLVITTLAFLASWCSAFYLCVLLFRIASAIQVLAFRSNQAEASQVFLAYNRFWKTLGILITTLLVMAFLLTFMFMALGASLAPLFSPNN